MLLNSGIGCWWHKYWLLVLVLVLVVGDPNNKDANAVDEKIMDIYAENGESPLRW